MFLGLLVTFMLALASLPAKASFKATMERLLQSSALKEGRIGIEVVRLKDGRSVFSHNSDRLFSVASNNKLFLTAAALHLLGRDYQFETIGWTPGKISPNGTLEGDVIVRGSGDPNISARFQARATTIFEGWADELLTRGIRKVDGRIIGDPNIFDRQYVHPSWPKKQLTHWYCAPVSGLALNDNCIDVTIKPGRSARQPLAAISDPETSYVRFRIRGRTSPPNTRSAVWFQRNSNSNIITIGGKHPAGGSPYKDSITVHDPASYFIHVLREVLIRKGITVTGEPALLKKSVPLPKDKSKLLFRFHSELLDSLRVTNKRSQNFYAEQILKTLGASEYGKGTFKNGVAVVTNFLSQIAIPDDSFKMVDGSGLARGNRFTPRQFVHLLNWVYRQKLRDDFMSTLAIGGVDGTLARRFKSEQLRGRVMAKTGSISGVSALSGYVRAKSDSLYAFSILYNSNKGVPNSLKKLQYAICDEIVTQP